VSQFSKSARFRKRRNAIEAMHIAGPGRPGPRRARGFALEEDLETHLYSWPFPTFVSVREHERVRLM